SPTSPHGAAQVRCEAARTRRSPRAGRWPDRSERAPGRRPASGSRPHGPPDRTRRHRPGRRPEAATPGQSGQQEFRSRVLACHLVLVWMDLEMTGLDPGRHVIVEIATLVTDDELNVVA